MLDLIRVQVKKLLSLLKIFGENFPGKVLQANCL